MSFSFNISPSNEYSGLISFRMDWLDLLAVQGTRKSLLQHYSLKASVLLCSAFFMVQLSHPYMTTGKAIALTRWTFVDKVMFLLFNMLSRLIIAFLLRSSVQFSSVAQLCLTLCDPMDCNMPGYPVHYRFLEFVLIHFLEMVMPSNHLILCHPLLLPSSVFPSIRVFSNESVLCIRCPKYWSFSFGISPSNEYPGLTSFDWLDLLAVQGTLKSLLQHHHSKVSIVWHSASIF